MDIQEEKILLNCFQENLHFGILLPNGWVGRPYDNFYSIKTISFTDKEIIIKLKQEMILEITKPFEIKETSEQICIKSFPKLVVQKQLYGNGKLSLKEFNSGHLIFKFY